MTQEKVIIPADYKDYIYRVTYYFLGKVAPCLSPKITPNQLTICGFIAAVLGSILLLTMQSPAAYLYWTIFNFIWYIFDALDGIHARLTKQTSEFGGFLDHFLDIISFIFIFMIFILKFDLMHPIYLLIILLRFSAVSVVFLSQLHSKRNYLTPFSGGLEFLLMTVAMMMTYLFPHLDLTAYTHGWLSNVLIETLNLNQGVFMKLTLLIYGIGVPWTFVILTHFVWKNTQTNTLARSNDIPYNAQS